MIYPKNPERDRERYTNAAITRTQFRIQWAKVRKGIPRWYQRLTRQKPAER